MKLHHLRNATLVAEAGAHVLLVDPMLGKAGTLPPFSFFRAKRQRNPLVELPAQANDILERVTHCLITHLHPDHLDKEAMAWLKQRKTPITCSIKDEGKLRKNGLNVVQSLDYWKGQELLGGTITGIPARHGYGFIAKPAGNVMGFHVALPGQPSFYVSADTVYTQEVKRALTELKPDVAIVASGKAWFDFAKPLLMTLEDVVAFVRDAPGQVLANHMEALNHCHTTREALKAELAKQGLEAKVFIPQDGEAREY